MTTNATPDIPEADAKTKEQEVAASLGLSDHRALTTADVPAIAEYIKETSKPKRSSGTSSAKTKKGGSK